MNQHVTNLLTGLDEVLKELHATERHGMAASLNLLMSRVRANDEKPKKPIVKAGELQLADVVRLHLEKNDPYADMTVKAIADGAVTFYRPYTHTGDFSCAAGEDRNKHGLQVLCYVGISEFRVALDDKHTEFDLIDRRKDPVR